MCNLPFFCHILPDGRGLCPQLSATHCQHGRRLKDFTTKSGCADELHPKDPGRFYGDVTAVFEESCDVIIARLVKFTSPRNLRVIYGVNRNLEYSCII